MAEANEDPDKYEMVDLEEKENNKDFDQWVFF